MTIAFSVVICSWNRVDMLEDTVNSVLACHRSDTFSVDVIVVDNASTDGTSERMAPFAAGGGIRLLQEQRPGLSFARNTGVQSSTGSWIVFLDDDVLLPADFFQQYALAMMQFSDAGFFAGPVIPTFDEELPDWARDVLVNHEWCFSALDLGGETRALREDQFPFGANMAIRRDVALRFPFETELGFKHGSMIPGEETALFKAILAAGFHGMWIAQAPVRHRLPAARAKLKYLLRRAFGQGRADAFASAKSGLRSRWLFVEIARLAVKVPFTFLLRKPNASSEAITLARCVGHVAGLANKDGLHA